MKPDDAAGSPELVWIYETDGRILAKIEEDAAVGFYLYIFDPVSGKSTHDHLQDTLDIAMEQAEEEFGLAIANWKQQEPHS